MSFNISPARHSAPGLISAHGSFSADCVDRHTSGSEKTFDRIRRPLYNAF